MPTQSERISRITVRGFKSIVSEQAIDIRPLTVLAGANSSGKSSIMQPLLLLKQTLEDTADPGPLKLDGPNVRFTEAEQLLARLAGDRIADSFCVEFNLLSSTDGHAAPLEMLRLSFRVGAASTGGPEFKIDSMAFESGVNSFDLHEDMTSGDIALEMSEPVRGVRTSDRQLEVWRERCFLVAGVPRRNDVSRYHDASEDDVQIYFRSVLLVNRFGSQLRQIIHLPGLRAKPERSYARKSGGPHFAGTFDEYAASVIARWQESGDERLRLLSIALDALGLTWKVESKRIDATQIEVRVGRLTRGRRGRPDMVNIADVGFGVSQVLPVVVALAAAEPNQLVYIEQPEIHLHPLAQRRLAGVIAQASQRGVQVVIETHSALLLRGIQTLVAQRKLDPSIVKLHWFHRDERGRTTIDSVDLDENGAHGPWPADFEEVSLDADEEYLNAVEERAGAS
ncbi:MAG: AAA family ATPase [Planctomycetes bacterium]|nr:AAA family ATPase [Planctomycetota bacterium]